MLISWDTLLGPRLRRGKRAPLGRDFVVATQAHLVCEPFIYAAFITRFSVNSLPLSRLRLSAEQRQHLFLSGFL